ncbi:MAG: alpha/beta fold hydrolase [Candidatus Zixiibacteriota bacterium]
MIRSKKRLLRAILWSAAGLILFANLAAYWQVRSMTHYSTASERTTSIEKLTFRQRVEVLLEGANLPRPVLDHTPWDYGLDFNSFRVPVDSQITLDVWEIPCSIPSGTVILFHGYGAAKSDLLSEAKAFRGMGYSCWLVDFRGSGSSTGNETSIGYYEADDVAAVCQEYRRRDTLPLILYGVSMGAASILRAVAVEGVRPNGIIIEGIFDRMLTTVANRFHIMKLPAFPLANLLVFWGGVDQGFDAFDNNPVDYALHIPCPVLQLHGALDRRATLADAQAVFRNLRDPKELVVFEQTGHESCLASDPVLWKQSVLKFCRGIAEK